MSNVVDCPNCETPFDAVEDTGRIIACPHCQKKWSELHAMVDPDYSEPENVEIVRNHDGSVEVTPR